MSKALLTQVLTSIQRVIALKLWELEAIKIDLARPFRLTSGNYSPLYVNCRELISSPTFVELFCAAARTACDALEIRFDVVAGGETAGIPFAAFLARTFGCPMIYVRKEPKTHGIATRIEGRAIEGARVLLVEDLITDAGSKLSFIGAVRDAGGEVRDVLVVFDRRQGGQEALAKVQVNLRALTDLDVALVVGEESKAIPTEDASKVRDYLRAPKAWHETRGLSFIEPR